ncbi:protein-disulfide reductase DsbD domain-containing protein [uncultured Croceitalea sp.]|uniref:protein-disulfide reductase DsbD domain-containing protein n=1 Tax=uncultured Croceitalea sp. TaxID=1798908 RepID=UPI00374F853C
MNSLKIFLVLCVFGVFHCGFSQKSNPVQWATEVTKLTDTEYELKAIATIEGKWHLYSQEVPAGGPLPTIFTFTKNETYSLVGEVLEEKGKTVLDPVFDMEIKYFENTATFRQRIAVLNKEPLVVNGKVNFMVCNDIQCLPPKNKKLSFTIVR